MSLQTDTTKKVNTNNIPLPEIPGVPAGTSRLTRSRQEQQNLLEKIALLSEAFDAKSGLELLPAPDGKWKTGGLKPETINAVNDFLNGKRASIDDLPPEAFRPTVLYYSVTDLENLSKDAVLSYARQQVRHAIDTNLSYFFKGQRAAIDEGLSPRAWLILYQAFQNNWIDRREMQGSEIVREQMRTRFSASLSDLDGKIASQPAIYQLALMVSNYWYNTTELKGVKDQKVLNTFAQIKSAIDKFAESDNQAENYKLFMETVWPKVRAVLDAEQKNEVLKTIARTVVNEDKVTKPGFFKRMVSFLTFGLFFSKPATNHSANEYGLDVSQTLKAEVEKPIIEKIRAELNTPTVKVGSSEAQEAESKKVEELVKKPKLVDDPDVTQLSSETTQALEQFSAALPDDKKKELESIARMEALERERELANSVLPPIFHASEELHVSSASQPILLETSVVAERDLKTTRQTSQAAVKVVAEIKKAEFAVRRLAELELKALQLKQEIERNRVREQQEYGFSIEERKLYNKFKELEDSIRALVDNFVQQFSEYLPKDSDYELQGGFYTGSDFDNKKDLVRRAILGDMRLRARRSEKPADVLSGRAKIILDNSGSMQGQKMEASLMTLIFFALVHQEFGLPFAIDLCGEKVTKIKRFEDNYDDANCRAKPDLLNKATANEDYTDLGTPLEITFQELLSQDEQESEELGVIFLISDGVANSGLVNERLRELADKVKSRYILINFLLNGSEAEIAAAKKQFGDECVISVPDFSKLPEAALNSMKQIYHNATSNRA